MKVDSKQTSAYGLPDSVNCKYRDPTVISFESIPACDKRIDGYAPITKSRI